ncbi:hypothetical protein ACFPES_00745 [Paenibacillus sp. GCM10023248]|uniref:hypothetical protein n=1 Tax=Bacillales TaxID=1385 RepID=UPI002378D7BB|nr:MULTISPECIES: hypothetical protein [Bacillales]MDD9265549.1 hypothetical protein [Paenibacillus sp. MAHUQ-63]MDR6878784.1 hypothetical protein [Bacillus sp. 3255]
MCVWRPAGGKLYAPRRLLGGSGRGAALHRGGSACLPEMRLCQRGALGRSTRLLPSTCQRAVLPPGLTDTTAVKPRNVGARPM